MLLLQVPIKIMQSVAPGIDGVGWLLLFLGWLLYWLKEINEYRTRKVEGNYVVVFWTDNVFEIPISLLSCLILAILSDTIPPELVNMHAKISTLFLGYGSSSILNGLITAGKNLKK